MQTAKRTNKHPNTIRRNTALHAQVLAIIAEQQERAGLATYKQIIAQRQTIGWRITT